MKKYIITLITIVSVVLSSQLCFANELKSDKAARRIDNINTSVAVENGEENSKNSPEEDNLRTSGYVDLTCPIRTKDIAAHVGTIRWTYYDAITDTLHYMMECSGGPSTKDGKYKTHTYITWDAY